jgi:peptidoglycan/LPS O-acetylase OafA/YrhL
LGGEEEERMTRELLGVLAYELRMLRRRAVIPALTSLVAFLLAYIFSIVLAFDDTKDSTTVFNLDLGLVVSWLPPLVIFSVIDRNPVSSDRVG